MGSKAVEKNWDDNLEKYLTAIFGVIGTFAIIVSVIVKGITAENVLDGIANISGLIVAISVFIVANKLFQRDSAFNFREAFDTALDSWSKNNSYLITSKKEHNSSGIPCCKMLIDHSNVVNMEYQANELFTTPGKAAAFIYFPNTDPNIFSFEFRFTAKMFQRQEEYKNDIRKTVNGINKVLQAKYGDDKKITITQNIIDKTSGKITVVVSENKDDQSESLVSELISMLELTKTLVLAIA